MWKLKKLYRKTKNVIRWIPVIWADEQWDYRYLYAVLYFKLKCMEEFFRSDETHILYAENVANYIRIAKCLTKRLHDDEYLSRALIPFDKQYNSEDVMDFDENLRVVWSEDKKLMDAWDRACSHSNYMEKQDHEYLFDFLKRRIQFWWD